MRTTFSAPRTAARFLAPLALALLLALQATTASAGVGWCRADPLVTVNGRTGHVYVESTDAMLLAATGPILVEVQVPIGAIATAVPLDAGFGLGYTITVVENPKLSIRGNYVEVRIAVNAPASDGSLPVKVIFSPDDSSQRTFNKTGTANSWVVTGTARL